jgi:hypothetical protein
MRHLSTTPCCWPTDESSFAAWNTVSEAASQLLRSACLYFNALAQDSVAAAAAAATRGAAAETSFQAFAALRAMVLAALDVLRQDEHAATALAGGDAGVAAIAGAIAGLENDIRKVRAVLLGEEFGGCHQGDLQASGERVGGDQRRHRGFAGANVALEQAKHGARAAEVIINFRHHSRLCAGEGETERCQQLLAQRLGSRENRRLKVLRLLTQLAQRELMGEQFFQREALLRRMMPLPQRIYRSFRRRPMHIHQRLRQARQGLREDVVAGDEVVDLVALVRLANQHFQRLSGELAQARLMQAFRGRIDGC